MKRINQIFNGLVLLVDLISVFAAFLLAYLIRASDIPFSVIYIWPFNQYIKFALQMLPVWVLALAVAGTYSGYKSGFLKLPQIIAASSLGSMAVVLWVFIFRSDFFSRLIVFYIWVLSIILIMTGRAILAGIRSAIATRYKTNLIIIGNNNPTTAHIVNQVISGRKGEYCLQGIVANRKLPFKGVDYLGTPDKIEDILSKKKVEEVILSDPTFSNKQTYNLLLTCQEKNICFKVVPTHAQVGSRTLEFDAFAGIPIIEFKGTPLDGWGSIIKRIFDFIGSLIALIIFSPLMLAIFIAIKTTSRGPAIYRNKRIGQHKEFITYKFRTMKIEYCTGREYGGKKAQRYEQMLIKKQNIKNGSAVYKIKDDPRVTPIGRFLRQTSLDELPQFYNVLIGNMSLVGPRPHQPREVAKYTREQKKTLLIKPGITGLAQISGRSDLTFDEEARLDIYYIENWSFWLDLYIIIRTFSAVLKGKGTY